VDNALVVDVSHDNLVAELQDRAKHMATAEQDLVILLGRQFEEHVITVIRKSKKKPWAFDILGKEEAGGETGHVSNVKAAGVAAQAGLRNGDIVTRVGDTDVHMETSNVVLNKELALPNDTCSLHVLRRPDVSFSYASLTINRAVGETLGFGLCTYDNAPGGHVTNLKKDGVCAQAGLMENDAIYSINKAVIGYMEHDSVLKLIRTCPAPAPMTFIMYPRNYPELMITMETPRLVCMTRSAKVGLGMKIITSSDGVSYPRISKIMPGQAAELTGQIAVGDRIMRVNDVDLKGASHDKAIQTLIQAANLSLVLVSDGTNMPQPTNVVAPVLPSEAADNTPMNSPAPKRKFTQADVGKRVSVEGYPGLGTIRFIGPHEETSKLRCGIEMDGPVGKNNGTVKGNVYFECADKYGVLCTPHKVTLTGARASAGIRSPLAGGGDSGRSSRSGGGTSNDDKLAEIDEVTRRVEAMSREIYSMFNLAKKSRQGTVSEDVEDELPSLPIAAGNDDDDDDDDDLPDMPMAPVPDDDDDALPSLGAGGDDDDALPSLGGGGGGDDSEDELPSMGGGGGDDDEDLPPPPVIDEVDLDAINVLLGYDATNDTEI